MSRYTPIADLLPAVYQSDTESFDQIDSYLSLVDELQRGYLDRLEHLDTWLSPNGPAYAWPLDVAIDDGASAVFAAVRELYDELASWTAFTFPSWWAIDDGVTRRPDLQRQRDYLARAARFWRRRGTPRGFVDWFCFAFGIGQEHRPYLLEHFKYGRPICPSGEERGPDPWLRATLLVPSTEQFDTPEMRRIVMRFVETYAPAHVHMRVCFVTDDFELYLVEGEDEDSPVVRPIPARRPSSGSALSEWREEVDDFRTHVRSLLGSLVGNTSHSTALQILTCTDEGLSKDRLGVARLTGGGTFASEEEEPTDGE